MNPMSDDDVQFTTVHTLTDRFEADMLMEALQSDGIPALLRPFEETPYSGLFVFQKGWGKILVPQEFATEARELIRTMLNEMQFKSYLDPAEVDPLLWDQLREADPDRICKNAAVRYDPNSAAYIIPFLDTELLCYPERRTIESPDSSFHRLDFELYLIVLHYLLEASPKAPTGKWISGKDIPSGETFFKGPHSFPVDPIIELFTRRPDLFQSTSKELGGEKVEMGDIAFRFPVFPKVPLLFVLWEGDEEFGPAMNILFDETINIHLQTLDTIWAMVNIVCRSFCTAGESLLGRENG
jgi:hypothetical protein